MSRMFFLLATFFAYVLNTVITLWYGHRLFGFKKDLKHSVLICSVANVVLWLLLITLSNEVVNIISTLLLFWIILLTAFNCDWKLATFHSLLLVAVMWISEYIILFLVSYVLNLEVTHFKNELVIFPEETFASKFLYFFLLSIISSFPRKSNERKGHSTSIYLTILPVTTFFMTIVLRVQSQYFESTKTTAVLCISAEIMMFVANMVVFAVHEKSLANQQKIHDLELLEQKQTINLEYLDILERKDEETRIFIHDIRNNLLNIGNLTDEEQVKEYIQNIYAKSNEISIKAKTKNRLLDVIINKYALLCKDKNIEFSTVALNENLSFVSDYDMSAILDNLLGNAVECAENELNPYIHMQLDSDNVFHKIIISNSCSVKPKSVNETLLTTKKNKDIHGYGIKSVLKAIENYKGEMQWTHENNEFKIVILMPI